MWRDIYSREQRPQSLQRTVVYGQRYVVQCGCKCRDDQGKDCDMFCTLLIGVSGNRSFSFFDNLDQNLDC